MVSAIGQFSFSDLKANMRVQIVNVESGVELCSKEFSYPSTRSPTASSYALLGPDRNLAYCGGSDDGNCYRLDPKMDGSQVFIQGGPSLSLHASLVSNNNQKWLLIGAG